MTRTIYWLWLASRPDRSIALSRKLLEHFGTPENIWRAAREDFAAFPDINQARLEALLDKDLTFPQRIEQDCARQNITIVPLDDPRYPAPLREINDPPLVLYVRGTLPDFTGRLSISIVGTRRCSPYGKDAARHFAGKLAQKQCLIVSGMALGIDGTANAAALDAGGETVAVLGCGVDVCYPWQNKALYDRIIERGAVISEYPPGTEPVAWHFPARNRIITGLSAGTLVVEAPKKSGALISADLALEQGREVFAVPGDINRANSAGCNQLIRQGGAELVQSPADILAHFGDAAPQRSTYRVHQPKRKAPAAPARETPREEPRQPAGRQLEGTPQEQAVWRAVSAGQETVDALVSATGLPAAEVLTALTMLEVGQYVVATSSGYQAAADVVAEE